MNSGADGIYLCHLGSETIFIYPWGNRVTIPRWYLNLFIVFLLSGLWHGANWTFVIWGALNGFYLIFGIITKDLRKRFSRFIGLDKHQFLNNGLQTLTTFGLVTFSWIFFRAKSVSIALYIISHSIKGLYQNIFEHLPLVVHAGISQFDFIVGITAVIMMEAIHMIQRRYGVREWINAKPVFIRWGIYYIAILMIIFLGYFQNRQFIYFQF